MTQHEEPKLQLPKGWKLVNYYSLHLAYTSGTLFGLLQMDWVIKILLKHFKQETYDTVNAYVLIAFIVSAAGAGILGHLKGKKIKDLIDTIEDARKPR